MNLNCMINKVLLKHIGKKITVVNIEKWGVGAHNDCYKLDTDQGSYFLKTEKDTVFPRVRQGQIRREVKGIQYAQSAGIKCPEIIGYDFTKDIIGKRYLLEKFIDGDLVWELLNTREGEDKSRLEDSYDQFVSNLAKRLRGVVVDFFGEVCGENLIGQDKSFNTIMQRLSDMFIEDAKLLEIYTKEQLTDIEKAHMIALNYIRYKGKPALIHLDLGIHNIISSDLGNHTDDVVIDFGFCMFMAPYASYYGPSQFSGRENEIAAEYEVTPEELKAFSFIFSMDMLLFFAEFKIGNYIEMVQDYYDETKSWLQKV